MQRGRYLLWEGSPAVLMEIAKGEQSLDCLAVRLVTGETLWKLQTPSSQVVRALELYTKHEHCVMFVQRINFSRAYVWWQPVVPSGVGKAGVLTLHSIAQKIRIRRHFHSLFAVSSFCLKFLPHNLSDLSHFLLCHWWQASYIQKSIL